MVRLNYFNNSLGFKKIKNLLQLKNTCKKWLNRWIVLCQEHNIEREEGLNTYKEEYPHSYDY